MPSSQSAKICVRPGLAASRISSLLKKPANPGIPAMASVAIEHRPIGDGNFFAQAAHFRHVLLAAHGVDHAAGGQEEQALEESVGHQVEDARGISAGAAGEEHVAKLRDGGIGENFFDVRLDEADGGRIERRDRAHDRRRQTWRWARGKKADSCERPCKRPR